MWSEVARFWKTRARARARSVRGSEGADAKANADATGTGMFTGGTAVGDGRIFWIWLRLLSIELPPAAVLALVVVVLVVVATAAVDWLREVRRGAGERAGGRALAGEQRRDVIQERVRPGIEEARSGRVLDVVRRASVGPVPGGRRQERQERLRLRRLLP